MGTLPSRTSCRKLAEAGDIDKFAKFRFSLIGSSSCRYRYPSCSNPMMNLVDTIGNQFEVMFPLTESLLL